MLKLTASRKNRIDLSDYDVERDIENRLLMSHFSVFDVEVLEEVLVSSLVTPIPKLAEALDADADDVVEVADRLSQTGLLNRIGDVIHVDKEMRKYFEFQILKFDDHFEPNIDFIQSLLRKLPIHVLPQWYAVPRTSSNIFQSIIDKYLATPRLYQRYLLELQFEDPVLRHMMDDVFNSPALKVRSRELRDRYELSRPVFEKYMLFLEFNFVCCLSYNRVGDQWKEVVTPFQEWRELLRFRRETIPSSIGDEAAIQAYRTPPFAFVKDASALLNRLKTGPLPVYQEEGRLFLNDTSLGEVIRHCEQPPASSRELEELPRYLSWIIAKLCLTGLVRQEGDCISLTERSAEWMDQSVTDRALTLYRHPQNSILSDSFESSLMNERNYREVEKATARVSQLGWVDFESFFPGVMTPIGSAEEVTLKKVGRYWSYVRPSYTPQERRFIKAVIFELFVESGLVVTGTHCGSPCFMVTPFGREMLSSPID